MLPHRTAAEGSVSNMQTTMPGLRLTRLKSARRALWNRAATMRYWIDAEGVKNACMEPPARVDTGLPAKSSL